MPRLSPRTRSEGARCHSANGPQCLNPAGVDRVVSLGAQHGYCVLRQFGRNNVHCGKSQDARQCSGREVNRPAVSMSSHSSSTKSTFALSCRPSCGVLGQSSSLLNAAYSGVGSYVIGACAFHKVGVSTLRNLHLRSQRCFALLLVPLRLRPETSNPNTVTCVTVPAALRDAE